jgi:hypothetical protein
VQALARPGYAAPHTLVYLEIRGRREESFEEDSNSYSLGELALKSLSYDWHAYGV